VCDGRLADRCRRPGFSESGGIPQLIRERGIEVGRLVFGCRGDARAIARRF
jgi:hypothetical protein